MDWKRSLPFSALSLEARRWHQHPCRQLRGIVAPSRPVVFLLLVSSSVDESASNRSLVGMLTPSFRSNVFGCPFFPTAALELPIFQKGSMPVLVIAFSSGFGGTSTPISPSNYYFVVVIAGGASSSPLFSLMADSLSTASWDSCSSVATCALLSLPSGVDETESMLGGLSTPSYRSDVIGCPFFSTTELVLPIFQKDSMPLLAVACFSDLCGASTPLWLSDCSSVVVVAGGASSSPLFSLMDAPFSPAESLIAVPWPIFQNGRTPVPPLAFE
jgi:hypothetical protein